MKWRVLWINQLKLKQMNLMKEMDTFTEKHPTDLARRMSRSFNHKNSQELSGAGESNLYEKEDAHKTLLWCQNEDDAWWGGLRDPCQVSGNANTVIAPWLGRIQHCNTCHTMAKSLGWGGQAQGMWLSKSLSTLDKALASLPSTIINKHLLWEDWPPPLLEKREAAQGLTGQCHSWNNLGRSQPNPPPIVWPPQVPAPGPVLLCRWEKVTLRQLHKKQNELVHMSLGLGTQQKPRKQDL